MKLTLAEILRSRIEASEETLYAIAKGSGVAYPVLYRFVSGERDLTLRTADKLCQYLNLTLREEHKK